MTNPRVGGDDLNRPVRPNADEFFNGTVEEWLKQARSEGQLDLNPVAQCRVCRDPVIMGLVNKMLARAFTISDILDTLDSHNLKLRRDGKPQITKDSVRNHRQRHFDTQAPASALYRKILERRAIEHGQDWEEGVGTVLNLVSFLEIVASKGFEHLIDPNTVVPYKDGADAMLKLHDIARKDEGALERAQTLAEMGRVIEVVRQFIPADRWPEVQAVLRGEAPAPQQTQAVEAVRMIAIDDSPDEEVD